MTGVFLQARLESTRLTNKALLELGGRPVIEQAMLQLRRVPAAMHVLLTDAKSADLLQRPAQRCGFELFVGPEENVLERFVLAARRFAVDEIIRATGDNPLVSWELARMAAAGRRRHGAHYFGFDGPPLGTGVEVVTREALEEALRSTKDAYDREHVTPFLYRNRERFVVVRTPAPVAYRMPHSRVTLDTREDYLRLCEIYDAIYQDEPLSVMRLMSFLESAAAGEATEENVYSSGA
jgi:spore coat polysaccharide biosynthesis protein SpsF